ncbi:MAG: alternative ribosome rescue aminoacyl-tRNA hydrolase ArfB [Alphaproteobacteria bacterium]|jgi:ribosome-associated protein
MSENENHLPVPGGGGIAIDPDEIEWQFVRASGPGGQNVNRVASAVQLRFDVARSPSLADDVRARLIAAAGRRVNRDGILVIDARRFRTQARNRADALERLLALIRDAAVPPKPRARTRPSAASRRRRLESKKRRGVRKILRGTVRDDD